MADSKLAMAAKPVMDPTDEIRLIIVKYLNLDIGASGADSQILNILVRRGWVSKKQIPPHTVCFHNRNRRGIIGASAEVETLMEDINHLHWSREDIGHALCFAFAPGDTAATDAFRIWCAAAELDFHPVSLRLIEYASFVCGHQHGPMGDWLWVQIRKHTFC